MSHSVGRASGAADRLLTAIPRLSQAQIEHLQELLRIAGFDPGTIDGMFGPNTQAAIRAFEKDSGHTPHGVFSNGLIADLEKAATAAQQPTPEPATTGAWSPPPAARPTAPVSAAPASPVAALRDAATADPPLRQGAKGALVTQLQTVLKQLGYEVNPDGAYGPQTAAALKSFAAHNLPSGSAPIAGNVLTEDVARALASQADRPAFAAAVKRLADTRMAQWPLTYEQTEMEMGDIHKIPPGPDQDTAILNWISLKDAQLQGRAAQLSKIQPDWAKDWAEVKSHWMEAARSPGQLLQESRFSRAAFEETAKKRLVSNLGLVSDGLKHVDPQLTLQFSTLLEGLEGTDAVAQSAGFKNLISFMRQNHAQVEKGLPPAARRAWVEVQGTLEDAERTGRVKPLTDFMLSTFLRHTLDSIKVDENDPASAQLNAALTARLQKLEAAATPNAGKPFTGPMLQAIARSVPGGAPLSDAKAAELARAYDDAMQKAGITTMREKAAFIAQCCQETGGFKWFHELGSNSYFDKYDNRSDLGNRGHPDGATFKGRGALQITGRSNYGAYSQWAYHDNRAVLHPELLEQPDDAFASAGWYWLSHGLNKPAEANNFELVTRRINGGLNGEANRLKYYATALAQFAQ